ncbi:hypothetical protein Tco_0760220 [Tanacetum coccineum]
MSDSDNSTVTYTAISSPIGGLSNIRSPGVDGPPVMPKDPYAYMVAAFQALPSPDYVPGPEYPPLPEFVPESDPEDDDDEDPEEDPADYPTDRDDDDDEEEEDEHDEDEEEEHPAPADSVPPLIHRVTARISIRPQTPVSLPSNTEVARLLDIPTPTSSPISPWSSPLPQIPSPPLPAPSTCHSLPLPPPIILSRTRSDPPPSGTPPILLIPLPTLSPSLLLPSADHGADRPEVCLPPRKRLCFAFGPRYEVGEISSAPTARPPRGFRADYGFVATMDREIMQDLERDIEFATRVRQDTDEIYVRLDDEQTKQQLMAGRLNMLYRDRRAHDRTALLMEREARMSRDTWGRSMDASDLVRSEVMSLCTTVLGQHAVITELQAADRKRQAAIIELLVVDRRRQAQFTKALKLLRGLQTQMTELI